jgi:HEAT repeat protein
MNDWATVSWWTGAVLGAVALLVIALAMLRDRSRGRRRCPRCWYDMSGVVGFKCPECGRTQSAEKRFFRTRRRWRMAAAGAVLMGIAGATAISPAVYTGKWSVYTPVPVLRSVLSLFKSDAAAVDARTGMMFPVSALTSWERLLLASVLARDLAAELDSPTRPARRNAAWAVNTPRGPGQRRAPYEACSMAADLGDEWRVMRPELKRALASPDQTLRFAAVNAIASLGPKAISLEPDMRTRFEESNDVTERQACLRILDAFQTDDPRTLSVLRRAALSDRMDDIRMESAAFLLHREPEEPTTLEAFIGLVGARWHADRRTAISTLGWYAHSDVGRPAPLLFGRLTLLTNTGPIPPLLPSQEAAAALAGLLEDPDRDIRTQAATLLAGMGARVTPYGPALRSRMEHEEDPNVRRAMISAYVKVTDADVDFILHELVALVGSAEAEVQRWAAWQLAECGPRAAAAVPALRRAALDDPYGLEGMFCQAMGFIGGEGWVALDEILRLERPSRALAARSLGMAGTRHPEAAAYLLAAIREEGSPADLRSAAALGLHFCEGHAEAARLLADLARGDPDAVVRRSALIALGSVKDPAIVVPACVAALRDADHRARSIAALTLRERAGSDPESQAALDAGATDPDPLVREVVNRIVPPTLQPGESGE